jgi:ABC-type transport system involved in multi-copper enzyme maturation permease subunit
MLVRHSLRRVRTLLLVMAGALALFQVLLALAAQQLQQSGTFAQLANIMPSFVRELFGTSLLTMLSFSGIMALGYYHVAITAVLVALAITIGTEPVAEIEVGIADVILARPVARVSVLTRSVVLLVAGPALVIGAMVGGTFLGLWIAGPPPNLRPPPSLVGALALNLWALIFCCGGIALAIGSVARRRSVAGSIGGAAATSLMLADYLSRVWSPLKPIARFSPFHYYNPLDLVMGRPLSMTDVGVLVGAGVVGIAAAYVLFTRRDV